MSVNQQTCYTIKCDQCGNDNESWEGYIPHYDSVGDAEGEAREHDWDCWQGHHICEGCGPMKCTCGHGLFYHDEGDECEECDCQAFEMDASLHVVKEE